MPQAVVMQELFDKVAWRYDLVNRVLSAGSDKRWRKAVVLEVLRDNPRLVLDVASGTGDQCLAIEAAKDFKGRVVCTDISWEMLRRGRGKSRRKSAAVLADAHRMAMRGGVFDCATICFGVRNFDNIVDGMKEIARVLRPGGKIVVLEFTRPSHPLVWKAYRWYLTKILPAIGGALSGQTDAYRYLASSIEGFLTPPQLASRLESAGFSQVRHRFLSAGIVAITTAIRKEK